MSQRCTKPCCCWGHPLECSGSNMLTDLRFADPLLALFVLLTVARTEGGRCAGATTRTSGRGDASLRGLPTFTRSSGFVSVDDLCCGGGVGVLDRGKLATSLVTDSDRIDPNVWSGDKLAPTLCTIPLLTEPEVTKKWHWRWARAQWRAAHRTASAAQHRVWTLRGTDVSARGCAPFARGTAF